MSIQIPGYIANTAPPTSAEIKAEAEKAMAQQRFDPSFPGSPDDLLFKAGQITEEAHEAARSFHQWKVDQYYENAKRRLEARHEDSLRTLQPLQEANAKALDATTQRLRDRYFSVPGGTEEGFQKALPDLLEETRRRAALSEDDQVRANNMRHLRSIL